MNLNYDDGITTVTIIIILILIILHYFTQQYLKVTNEIQDMDRITCVVMFPYGSSSLLRYMQSWMITSVITTPTVNQCIFQWMIDAMQAKGHNMTYSKFRVGGSAVQVIKYKYLGERQKYL